MWLCYELSFCFSDKNESVPLSATVTILQCSATRMPPEPSLPQTHPFYHPRLLFHQVCSVHLVLICHYVPGLNASASEGKGELLRELFLEFDELSVALPSENKQTNKNYSNNNRQQQQQPQNQKPKLQHQGFSGTSKSNSLRKKEVRHSCQKAEIK